MIIAIHHPSELENQMLFLFRFIEIQNKETNKKLYIHEIIFIKIPKQTNSRLNKKGYFNKIKNSYLTDTNEKIMSYV